jgi:hypothetical protein
MSATPPPPCVRDADTESGEPLGTGYRWAGQLGKQTINGISTQEDDDPFFLKKEEEHDDSTPKKWNT